MRYLCLTVFASEFKGQSKFCLCSGIPSGVDWERFDSSREVGTSTWLDAYKHCGVAFGDSCPCQTTTRQEELGGGAQNLVKRDVEDGLVNQIDIYIFSRLCNGWWSDSYGKEQDSSADKSKASKAPKEDDGVWPVCLQGGFGYYFVPLVQYFESLHWDRFFAHKGYPG